MIKEFLSNNVNLLWNNLLADIRNKAPLASPTAELRDCSVNCSSPWTWLWTSIQPLEHVRRSHGGFVLNLQVSEENFVSLPTGRPLSPCCLRVITFSPPSCDTEEYNCWVVRRARFTAPGIPPGELDYFIHCFAFATQLLLVCPAAVKSHCFITSDLCISVNTCILSYIKKKKRKAPPCCSNKESLNNRTPAFVSQYDARFSRRGAWPDRDPNVGRVWDND